jgi:ABC-type thiamine transport system ATPase subunit
VTPLAVSGLVWEAAGARYRIEPERLDVPAGQVAAVVAEPPAVPEPGPVLSVLADILVGLEPAPEGATLSAAGREVGGEPAGRRPFALVPPGGALLPHLTVARNIEYGLSRRLRGKARARARAGAGRTGRLAAGRAGRAARAAPVHSTQVRHLEQRFHLEGALALRPDRLSPEQRLRVAVARALCGEPVAIIIEDRSGQVPWATTASLAAGEDVAVVVLTDSSGRTGPPAARVARVVRSAADEQPGADPRQPGADRPRGEG